MFDFIVELVHDIRVDFLDLLFKLEYLLVYRKDFAFHFSQLELVNVFYFFHFVGGLQVLDELGLLLFNSKFFFLQLLNEICSLFVVEGDVIG